MIKKTLFKHAFIITAYYNYDYPIRVKYLTKYLESKKIKVTIVSADFDHRNKEYYKPENKEILLIHVPAYSKNLSVKRIISHIVFSEKCKNICEKIQPDLIYAITPPNFMFKTLCLVKKNRPNMKLIYEIEDLWPETIPLSLNTKKILYFPMMVWRNLRKKYINTADAIVCECNLYKDYLSNSISEPYIKTIYLSKDDIKTNYNHPIQYDTFNFLYLGSINNLIDIDLIIEILCRIKVSHKVELHIIGNGEQRTVLMDRCKKNMIKAIYYGIVYDESEKQKIMSLCHFAFNIMKENVFVGVTMKSLEYFQFGIPIINNIGGDSKIITDKYRCGFNVNRKNLQEIEKKITENLNRKDYLQLCINSRQVYEELFCPNIFYASLDEMLKKIECII